MKKIIILLILAFNGFLQAQIIIGGAVGTATDQTSVLLDFAKDKNKGLIVPYVRTLPQPVQDLRGSILVDASDAAKARVKFCDGISWNDLSGQDAVLSGATGVLASQPQNIVEGNSKSIIGARTTVADGVLVLESTTQAMVLPQVVDVQNILSPSPGMIVYVNKAGAKRLAVYNGSKWSFFKP